jgi:hypothetical protein
VARAVQERLKVLELWRAGYSGKGLARASGIPRSTVRDWLRRFAGVAQSAEAADLKSAQWGFESLHQHQHPIYVYLLGLYLGDGQVARMPRTYNLRIFLNQNQPYIIAEAVRAILQLLPTHRVGFVRRGQCVTVSSYSKDWPAMLPQHGPGRKHRRRIVLEPWQEKLVASYPGQFVRGCIHSDGCRHRRLVKGKNYPAYEFSNRSQDILDLFTWACRLLSVHYTRSSRVHISIARRPDVARLDAVVGWPENSQSRGSTTA